MAAHSKIEWTSSTWNPITGCTKISSGCEHCYAEKMSLRLMHMGKEKYKNGFQLTIHEECFNEPIHWKKPQTIFVNSMSDLFHKDVPVAVIQRLFSTMKTASWHTFQVLTKRSDRLLELNKDLDWVENIWMGVTIEASEYLNRLSDLTMTDAFIKFLSLEPLLGPLGDLDLSGINWVIVGGESGPGARPMEEAWVLEIRDQCLEQNIPFFFKQWGGVNKKKNGRLLQGRLWDQHP